ncbi:MAG: pentapeptide MXKDX repeat protein, partial [Halothiobacillaceae bacterium]
MNKMTISLICAGLMTFGGSALAEHHMDKDSMGKDSMSK